MLKEKLKNSTSVNAWNNSRFQVLAPSNINPSSVLSGEQFGVTIIQWIENQECDCKPYDSLPAERRRVSKSTHGSGDPVEWATLQGYSASRQMSISAIKLFQGRVNEYGLNLKQTLPWESECSSS